MLPNSSKNSNKKWSVTKARDQDYYYVLLDVEWLLVNHGALDTWMQSNLPNGRDHLVGDVLLLDEKELLIWTLRWS